MECFSRYDVFLLVDGPVFSKTAQVAIIQNSWDDWLTDDSMTAVIHKASCEMEQIGNFCTLQDLDSLEVVIRLGEWRVRIAGCGVRVAERDVDGEREENLVVDVDVLSHWLVRVQGYYFTFDNGDRSLGCGFDKVTVHFSDSTVFLHPLNVVINWEVLDDLELFVPIMELFQVDTMQGIYGLSENLWLAYFDDWLWWLDPACVRLLRWGHEEGLGVEDTIQVDF